MLRYTRLLLTATLLFCTAFSGFAQTAGMTPQAGAKLQDIEAIVTEFIDNLSAQKFEKAVRSLSILGNPYDGDQFKRTILGLDVIGKAYYYDKIVDRFYGKTGKDIIYKITTENNIYFIRFIVHRRTEDIWIITNLAIQTETQAPLPKIWGPITP
ncbi:MAG: hypothetical protein J0I42_00485 [Bosea sp.]|uniref:hypothetical protein n=1 Tax=Bosea sp. (in: a-proteobacteria) TaxID=1871050 RepID=UPI001AD5E13F|nr:hypothetical protein [Bosea sp. (in: a-proteobacteria)]MBN9450399.1 hypothetical protein [Bosea sp. (in: a-proteobacteria)]